jgi:hypothetical protein
LLLLPVYMVIAPRTQRVHYVTGRQDKLTNSSTTSKCPMLSKGYRTSRAGKIAPYYAVFRIDKLTP